MNSDALRRAAAELMGTFALVFRRLDRRLAGRRHRLVGVALAHGPAIAVMASAVGLISGTHFNPAGREPPATLGG